jgi:Skp family chaperone for outer membrane proteins
MTTSLLRFILRIALPLALFASATAFGQTTGKIALIDTRQFYDTSKGIQKLVSLTRQVDGEFAAVQKELQALQTRIEALTAELQKQGANPSAARQDEAERLQRDFNFKRNEAQAAYERRRATVMTPAIEQINKALRDYLTANGIALILDASKLEGTILAAQPTIDVTQAFINDFNLKYPASPNAASNR